MPDWCNVRARLVLWGDRLGVFVVDVSIGWDLLSLQGHGVTASDGHLIILPYPGDESCYPALLGGKLTCPIALDTTDTSGTTYSNLRPAVAIPKGASTSVGRTG